MEIKVVDDEIKIIKAVERIEEDDFYDIREYYYGEEYPEGENVEVFDDPTEEELDAVNKINNSEVSISTKTSAEKLINAIITGSPNELSDYLYIKYKRIQEQ